MTDEPTVCAACRSGRHNHDTYTGAREGQDAGCSNIQHPGTTAGCTCPVRKPRITTGVKHCPTCTCHG